MIGCCRLYLSGISYWLEWWLVEHVFLLVGLVSELELCDLVWEVSRVLVLLCHGHGALHWIGMFVVELSMLVWYMKWVRVVVLVCFMLQNCFILIWNTVAFQVLILMRIFPTSYDPDLMQNIAKALSVLQGSLRSCGCRTAWMMFVVRFDSDEP